MKGKYDFSVTLQSCGNCVSHSHCRDCFRQLAETLGEKALITGVFTDPGRKQLTIESAADRDLLADLLDDMGVFVEDP